MSNNEQHNKYVIKTKKNHFFWPLIVSTSVVAGIRVYSRKKGRRSMPAGVGRLRSRGSSPRISPFSCRRKKRKMTARCKTRILRMQTKRVNNVMDQIYNNSSRETDSGREKERKRERTMPVVESRQYKGHAASERERESYRSVPSTPKDSQHPKAA